MPGSEATPEVSDYELCRDSVCVVAGIYIVGSDGSLRFDGERPGSDWHAHGWFSKRLTILQDGEPAKVTLRKRRWRLYGTNTTCHSRPPDDPKFVRFCTLIIVLRIWAWIGSQCGFDNRAELWPELQEGCGCDSSVRRLAQRAVRNAEAVQHAIRHALLSVRRTEPRPEQDPLQRGRAPPGHVTCRRWQHPLAVETLWRAIAILLEVSRVAELSVALLLAEARRRWQALDDIFPI